MEISRLCATTTSLTCRHLLSASLGGTFYFCFFLLRALLALLARNLYLPYLSVLYVPYLRAHSLTLLACIIYFLYVPSLHSCVTCPLLLLAQHACTFCLLYLPAHLLALLAGNSTCLNCLHPTCILTLLT